MSQADINFAQQRLAIAESRVRSAQASGDSEALRIAQAQVRARAADLARVQQASAGTPPANSVSPAVSPVASQLEGFVAEEYGIPANFAETAQPLPPSFDEQLAAFLDGGEPDPIPQNELPVQPARTVGYGGGRGGIVEDPGERAAALRAQVQQPGQLDFELPPTIDATTTPAPAPVEQAEVDLDLFSEGGDVTVTEESTVIRDPNAPIVENGRVINDTPDPLDQASAGFGGFVEDDVALDVAGGLQVTPGAVDNTQAQQQRIVPQTPPATDEIDFLEEERTAQINQAALDRLRQQSAAEQNRDPQGTGDWRVKLRLASGADYFYNAITQAGDDVQRNAGILAPLQATDGIVFPYTPSIQILYAADYNTYHPTHSNYQHYFYKGSKVGEVVMTATFTAQDTEEANYLLAVIHFLKSASKMFYGQDAERGSPPPLLFLTGLGNYQFNEAPCVISQFNYVLPNDVDYIRANVRQIRAGTLQYDLRNKNTGANLTSWSSKLNRLLTTPGLLAGAERTPTRINNQPVNLSSDDATYVPTKIEITLTLLPVQNRLQVSEGFSLKEYATGSLIKGGFW